MTSVASAPGKIVLAGEYAVLYGAPAICMAVSRRAVVTVSASAEDGPGKVSTPGYVGDDPAAILDVAGPVVRHRRGFELDTRAFSEHGRKIGLGSSAALTVALLAAVNATDDVFAEALEAHRRFQGGKGSGVDIATAVHGGLLQYTMPSSEVRPLCWPDGLEMRVLWTGVAASTADRLGKLDADRYAASKTALCDAAEDMAAAWRHGDTDRILVRYVSYIDALRQFSLDHELGIFDAGHDELTKAASDDDLVYKPAGAGGGDVGVLFGRDPAALDAFIREHEDLIHDIVVCELEPTGVRLETS